MHKHACMMVWSSTTWRLVSSRGDALVLCSSHMYHTMCVTRMRPYIRHPYVIQIPTCTPSSAEIPWTLVQGGGPTNFILQYSGPDTEGNMMYIRSEGGTISDKNAYKEFSPSNWILRMYRWALIHAHECVARILVINFNWILRMYRWALIHAHECVARILVINFNWILRMYRWALIHAHECVARILVINFNWILRMYRWALIHAHECVARTLVINFQM